MVAPHLQSCTYAHGACIAHGHAHACSQVPGSTCASTVPMRRYTCALMLVSTSDICARRPLSWLSALLRRQVGHVRRMQPFRRPGRGAQSRHCVSLSSWNSALSFILFVWELSLLIYLLFALSFETYHLASCALKGCAGDSTGSYFTVSR